MQTAIAFALPGFEYLLPEGKGAVGRLVLERFPNRELSLALETAVEGRRCSLVGSVAPPDEQLLGFLLAADTLRRHDAAQVTAILPYLGYARQDAPEPGRGHGIAWIGGLLSACGIERAVTVDAHSAQAAETLGLPLASLSPATLLAAELGRPAFRDAVIVAPDEGAIPRCRALAEAAGVEAPVAYLRKERTATGVAHRQFVGEVGRRVVIVDDILDTGATLVSCCQELQRRGVEETTLAITHGLFTGEAWKVLPSLGVRSLYVTDSVPGVAERAPDGTHVVPVRSLIEPHIAGLA